MPDVMSLFNEAKEKKAAAEREIDKLLGTVEVEDRPLTGEEKSKLTKLEQSRDMAEGAIQSLGQLPTRGRISQPGPPPDGWDKPKQEPKPSATGLSFRTPMGVVTALSPSDKLVDDDAPELGIGDVVVAALTGRKPEGLGAVVGGIESSGGYLLTEPAAGRFLDLARAASVCIKAGAQTLPMTTSELTIAKLDSDPTSYWRSETVAVTASQPSFGAITLKPKVLAAIVPCSIELLEDAPNAGRIIEQALAASLAQKLDQAALDGSGIGAEPRGILHTTGINAEGSIGAPTNSSIIGKLIPAVYKILNSNYNGPLSELAFVNHPRTVADIWSLVDSTYQPLSMGPVLSQLQWLTTTALSITEVGGAESSSIIGHFPSLLIGMRTPSVVVELLREGSVSDGTDTWNATSQLLRHIRVYLRADVAVLRPTWFCSLTGITT